MKKIQTLLENVTLPPLLQVRCHYENNAISCIAATVHERLNKSGIAQQLQPGMRIAIAVGSRGICDIVTVVAESVRWFKERGFNPFIVPSMGSHGGATASGQKAVLEQLGVTELTAGCPIHSSMDVVHLGSLTTGQPVYMDALAVAAEGVFIINRVKPHTSLLGAHQSGLVKMLVVGLGKQNGAESCHAGGYGLMPNILPRMAEHILGVQKNVLGGLAIIENAHNQVCHVEVATAENFIACDKKLLQMAIQALPQLPLAEIDVLVIDQIGKNISGSGMDPNITGRFSLGEKECAPKIKRIAVLGFTKETKGHATGIGNADAIPRSVYEQINFESTYANAITSTLFRGACIPMVLENDRDVLACMVKTCNAHKRPVTLIRIKDTLTLNRMLVSPAVAKMLQGEEKYQIITKPEPMRFSKTGTLLDKDIWERFAKE